MPLEHYHAYNNLSQLLYSHRTPVIGRLDRAIVMNKLSITDGGDLKLLLGLTSKNNLSINAKVLPVDYHIPLYEYISPVKAM